MRAFAYMTGTFEYTLEPDGAGTRVRFTCDVRPHGWMWLVLPWVVRESRLRYRDQLPNLKRVIREPRGDAACHETKPDP